VKEPLESSSNVRSIALIGGRKREVQIMIDPERLKAYHLSIVKKMGLAPGYTTGATGMGKMFAEMIDSFKLAFLLSIIGMYMVLAAQFESFLHPIISMLSLPLSVPLALLSWWISDQFLAIFSILGALLLFGIVKKNSILQVDHTINLRAQGCRATRQFSPPTGNDSVRFS
jgi:multidrug efflux pump subunit AcrB